MKQLVRILGRGVLTTELADRKMLRLWWGAEKEQGAKGARHPNLQTGWVTGRSKVSKEYMLPRSFETERTRQGFMPPPSPVATHFPFSGHLRPTQPGRPRSTAWGHGGHLHSPPCPPGLREALRAQPTLREDGLGAGECGAHGWGGTQARSRVRAGQGVGLWVRDSAS